ncbi:MAG TPA: signal peptidase II [Candidatus Dormibacteraeota bacterium]|nr:signal peptidase II [Candidatus Dormibacteraeota bacterium]
MAWVAIAAVLAFAVDQLSKAAVRRALVPDQSVVGIPHVFLFTYTRNTHGAFGLFGSHPALLIALALGVLVLFFAVVRRSIGHSLAVQVAFGMIVGGAAGNIADRLHYGYVVDFLQFAFWQAYPVFNVADSLILIGVVTLMLVSAEGGKPRSRRPETVMSQPESGGRAAWSEGDVEGTEYAQSPDDERALRRLRGPRPDDSL